MFKDCLFVIMEQPWFGRSIFWALKTELDARLRRYESDGEKLVVKGMGELNSEITGVRIA